ncbi:MAG: NAD(+)/NADH kinase, partial [Bacteroides sp.]|nr:NAD(+)/NADH kinase [Bacteroides sp.]
IGGDGTFLTPANIICSSATPIMGINAGHLGYLAATDIANAAEAARNIVLGHYTTELRTLLKVESNSAQLPPNPFALNEVAFLKQDTASIITVEARVNGNFLASYSGDGLIVATPTGSTGYNLSAGGPIMSPRAANWVITPVAPHSLSMRPLVIPDSATVEVRARSRSNSLMLAIDGRAVALPVETRFTLSKAPFSIKVAHLDGYTFIDTLRHKLHWG